MCGLRCCYVLADQRFAHVGIPRLGDGPAETVLLVTRRHVLKISNVDRVPKNPAAVVVFAPVLPFMLVPVPDRSLNRSKGPTASFGVLEF